MREDTVESEVISEVKENQSEKKEREVTQGARPGKGGDPLRATILSLFGLGRHSIAFMIINIRAILMIIDEMSMYRHSAG